jgi:ABC-type amino acid transport substrate-binding protein
VLKLQIPFSIPPKRRTPKVEPMHTQTPNPAQRHRGWRSLPGMLAALMLCALTFGPASAQQPTGRREAPEISRIVQRGELVVAMLKTDSPPFFYVRDQQLLGIDVDMAKEIAKELGVNVRFDRSATTFNEVVDKVSRGEVDMAISKLSRTLARGRAVLFSDPYLTLHHALVLNRLEFAKIARDRTPAEALKDYGGSLAVISKSSFKDFAQRNFPKATLREFPNWDEVVAAVQRGEVVAGYRDEFEVKRLLAEQPSLALKLRTVTLQDRRDTIGVAVPTDAPTLRAFVNLYLESRGSKLEINDVLKALPPVNKPVTQS